MNYASLLLSICIFLLESTLLPGATSTTTASTTTTTTTHPMPSPLTIIYPNRTGPPPTKPDFGRIVAVWYTDYSAYRSPNTQRIIDIDGNTITHLIFA